MPNTRRSFFQGLAGVAAVAPLALAKTEPVVEATMKPRSLGVTSLHPVIPEGSTIHEFNSLSKVPAHARRGWDIRWTGLKDSLYNIDLCGQWFASEPGCRHGGLFSSCPGGQGWLNEGDAVNTMPRFAEGQRPISFGHHQLVAIALEQRLLAYYKLLYLIDHFDELFEPSAVRHAQELLMSAPLPWRTKSDDYYAAPTQWTIDRMGPVCRGLMEAEIKAWKLG